MSADKPSPSVSGLTAILLLVAAVAAPAISYGIAQGGTGAEVSAIRDRVTVLEQQNAELRGEIRSLTRDITELKVMVGRIDAGIQRMSRDGAPR
jgi:hypothetical protein